MRRGPNALRLRFFTLQPLLGGNPLAAFAPPSAPYRSIPEADELVVLANINDQHSNRVDLWGSISPNLCNIGPASAAKDRVFDHVDCYVGRTSKPNAIAVLRVNSANIPSSSKAVGGFEQCISVQSCWLGSWLAPGRQKRWLRLRTIVPPIGCKFRDGLMITAAALQKRDFRSAQRTSPITSATSPAGIKRGAIHLGRLDLQVDADLEKLAGWSGAKLHANMFEIYGRGLSRNYIHNLATISEIEALFPTHGSTRPISSKPSGAARLPSRPANRRRTSSFSTAKPTICSSTGPSAGPRSRPQICRPVALRRRSQCRVSASRAKCPKA